MTKAKHWVKGYDSRNEQQHPYELCSAAFVDDTVGGLRPLGMGKSHDITSKQDVYQVYLLDSRPYNIQPMTKESFLNHLIFPAGQDSKRIPIAPKINQSLNPEFYDEVESVASEKTQERPPLARNASIPDEVEAMLQSVENWRSEIDPGAEAAAAENWLATHKGVMERDNSPTAATSSKMTKGKNKRSLTSGNAEIGPVKKNRPNGLTPKALSIRSAQSSNHGLVCRQKAAPPLVTNPLDVNLRREVLKTATAQIPEEIRFDPKARDTRAAQSTNGDDKKFNILRPSPKAQVTARAKHCLRRYVLQNPELPWGQQLLKGPKDKRQSIGKLAATSDELSGKQTIEIALRVMGIYSQPITWDLAKLINEALVNQSAEYYAEILQYLVGTNKKVQGRIEVEGTSSQNLQWYLFNQEKHGWEQLEGGNIYIMHALRGILLAYKEYLIDHADKIDGIFTSGDDNDAKAKDWFRTDNEREYHPVLHCYESVYNSIIGGKGAKACTEAVTRTWERLIRTRCIIPGKSISNILNEDKLKIVFTNGVFDLSPHGSNGYTLRPGRPSDFTSYRFDYKYRDFKEVQKDPKQKVLIAQWQAFFSELFPDKNVTQWMYRILASCLGGDPFDLLFILTGAGSNGKSIFLKLLETTFGLGNGYYITISCTKLTEKKTHSANADPMQFLLKGKRVRADTEPPENQPLNTSYVKERFDTQSIRQLYEGSVRQQHHFYKHFLACNTTPPSSGEDANTRRLVHIDMPSKFRNDPDTCNPLEKKIDDSVKRQLPQWRESLMSYLVALWQKHHGGHRDKTDPLRVMIYPQSIVRLNLRMLHNTDVASNLLQVDLVKHRYGCMEFKEIWKAYVEKWQAEHKTLEDQRLFVKMSKEQFERLVIKQYGSCKRVPRGPNKGDYYECMRAGGAEPTGLDARLSEFEEGMDPDLRDSLNNPDYQLPDIDGYENNAIKDGSVTGDDDDSEAENDEEESVIDLDGRSDNGDDRNNRRGSDSDDDGSDDPEDGNFGLRMPGGDVSDFSDQEEASIADPSEAGTEPSEISFSKGNQIAQGKRKRKMTRRLLGEVQQLEKDASVSGDSEPAGYDVADLPPAKIIRQIVDTDSENDENNENNAVPPPATASIQEEALFISAPELPVVAPKKRKRSKNHKNVNKFIDEGANVSGDDGDPDEEQEESENDSDRNFLHDSENDEVRSAASMERAHKRHKSHETTPELE